MYTLWCSNIQNRKQKKNEEKMITLIEHFYSPDVSIQDNKYIY